MPWIDSFVSSKKFSHEFVTEFIITEVVNLSTIFFKSICAYFYAKLLCKAFMQSFYAELNSALGLNLTFIWI